MRDEDDRDIYDLFFAGNHIEGYDRMKDAMWTVDPEHGMRFSDATDPEQAVMFQENPIDRLLDQIYEYFGGQKMPLGDIYDWVAENTAYCRRQAKDAIREAELNRPKFVILNKKKDGQTRRKNTHPPEAIIDFGQIPPKQGDLF